MKKATAISILFLYAIISIPGNLYAQTDSLNIRISKLERIVEKMPRISGLINMRYQYSNEDGNIHGFDIRRVRLDFQGDIGKSFDYRLQVEFAGSPKILDAYFRWKISRYINLQAGEFKIPFTLENIYGPHHLETIDNSMAITGLCGYTDLSGISANGRDIGLMLYGGFLNRNGYNLFDYSVGIFNGNGINVRDNNNNKDFSGRLSVNILKDLAISGSYYNGSTGRKGETEQRVRTAIGARYDDGTLLLRSEYLFGKTNIMKSEGFYAVGAYFVHPKWQPLVKFDYFREDKSDKDKKYINYIAGLNYFPIKYVRLQANYTFRTIVNGKDINQFAIQIFGVF